MRIASVEQIELGSVMDMSLAGQKLKWARQAKPSGGASLSNANGWNLKNQSHLTTAKCLRETSHPVCWLQRSQKVKNEALPVKHQKNY